MNVRFSNRPVGVERFQTMRRRCVDVAHGLSRFLRALFPFSKRAAGEATKFGRSGVEFLGVVGVACLECDEPAAEAGELIRRQLGDNFGDFFDFHMAQYSTDGAWLSGGCTPWGRRTSLESLQSLSNCTQLASSHAPPWGKPTYTLV